MAPDHTAGSDRVELELPPDLAEWTLIRREGKLFAVSRHGGTATFPDDPAALPALIAQARKAQWHALTFDPVTGRRRADPPPIL